MVGYMEDGAKIEKCYFNGTITGYINSDNYAKVGGLAGRNQLDALSASSADYASMVYGTTGKCAYNRYNTTYEITAEKITSAEDFKNMDQSSTYSYYKLTKDIDLNDLNLSSIFSSRSCILSTFTGEINGNGHTITMPAIGDSSNYACVIETFNGVLKNVKLQFNTIKNKEISWSYISSTGFTFENVTTLGSITTPSTTNYSPLIIYTRADSVFRNCTNNLDILGPIKYGSPFLGGAVLGTTKATLADKIALVADIGVSYINCVNNAILVMESAQLLYGNSYKVPELSNVVIGNCVNNGTIIGTISADWFNSIELNERTDVVAYNTKALSNIINNGEIYVQSLSGLSTSFDQNTREISITNTATGTYTYKLDLMVALTLTNGGVNTVITSINVNIGNTGYGYYEFIDDTYLNSLTNKTMTEISGSGITIRVNGGGTAKLYLVTNKSTGAKYYYLDSSWEYMLTNNKIEHCTYFRYAVIAYDSNGNPVGQVQVVA